MSKPFFSIIIPTLNEEHYLPHLLEDLSRQTFRDFETIVVDAKSTDQTLRRVSDYNEQLHPKVYQVDKRNVCIQRNLGAEHAKGKYLAFIDADCRIKNIYFEIIVRKITNSHCSIFTTWHKPDIKSFYYNLMSIINNVATSIKSLTTTPIVVESMLIIEKTTFIKLGMFNHFPYKEGRNLLKKAKQSGYSLSVSPVPMFTMSYRRIHSLGLYKYLMNNLKLEFLNRRDLNEWESVYPMSNLKSTNHHNIKHILK